jgi:pimeloyl-ACP methyl ester carboxylesterase
MHAIATAADGTEIHFATYGNAERPAVFLGPHFYLTPPQPDPSTTHAWIAALSQDFFLIVADYPRGIGLTRHPQGLAFNPEIAAQEYLQIANAAGVTRFGFLGYSFGGAMGVQLACRTDRIAALAVGGFPPLNAPFKLMTELSRGIAEAPPPLPNHMDPGVLQSAVGFYAPLANWPEREQISRLTMPRLVFMGDRDSGQGAAQVIPLADNLREAEHALRALGWQVVWLPGHDHLSAESPEVTSHLVHRFFSEALSR